VDQIRPPWRFRVKKRLFWAKDGVNILFYHIHACNRIWIWEGVNFLAWNNGSKEVRLVHSIDGMSPIPEKQCVESGPTREGAIHETRHLIAQRAWAQDLRNPKPTSIVVMNRSWKSILCFLIFISCVLLDVDVVWKSLMLKS
jgi:hypothetical protein